MSVDFKDFTFLRKPQNYATHLLYLMNMSKMELLAILVYFVETRQIPLQFMSQNQLPVHIWNQTTDQSGEWWCSITRSWNLIKLDFSKSSTSEFTKWLIYLDSLRLCMSFIQLGIHWFKKQMEIITWPLKHWKDKPVRIMAAIQQKEFC